MARILLALCVASSLGAAAAFAPSQLPSCLVGSRLGSICALPLRARTTGVAALSAQIHYGEIQHAGLLVKDTAKSVDFYTKVLGMIDQTAMRSPKLEYPGAFLGVGGQQIHLMELPIIDPVEGRPEHGGRDRHVAVTVKSLGPLQQSLDENSITYTMSKSGRRALFCRDLDQNAIEFVEDTYIAPRVFNTRKVFKGAPPNGPNSVIWQDKPASE